MATAFHGGHDAQAPNLASFPDPEPADTDAETDTAAGQPGAAVAGGEVGPVALRSAKRLRARIERRADALASDMRRALLLAYRQLSEIVPDAELQRRLAAGLDPYTDAEIDKALRRVRAHLWRGVQQAGAAFTVERKA